jgi:hypothetical protein
VPAWASSGADTNPTSATSTMLRNGFMQRLLGQRKTSFLYSPGPGMGTLRDAMPPSAGHPLPRLP